MRPVLHDLHTAGSAGAQDLAAPGRMRNSAGAGWVATCWHRWRRGLALPSQPPLDINICVSPCLRDPLCESSQLFLSRGWGERSSANGSSFYIPPRGALSAHPGGEKAHGPPQLPASAPTTYITHCCDRGEAAWDCRVPRYEPVLATSASLTLTRWVLPARQWGFPVWVLEGSLLFVLETMSVRSGTGRRHHLI